MKKIISISILLAAALLLGSVIAEPRQEQTLPSRDSDAGKWVRDDQGRTLYYLALQDPPLAAHASHAGRTAFPQGKARTLDVHAAGSRSYIARLDDGQNQVAANVQKTLSRNVRFENRYRILLNGVTAFMDEAEAARIASVPGVSRVVPVPMRRIQTDYGPDWVNAPVIWQGLDGNAEEMGEGVIAGIIDTGIRPDHPSFAARDDDGYDHVNPLGAGTYLGDCIEYPAYCNDKLIGIVSFPSITGAFVEKELPPVGLDYNGHGTHVAATVAGNILRNVPVHDAYSGQPAAGFLLPRVSGVAPRASIVSYQVCAIDGGCFPNLAAEAMEHAVANGINVVNYSIGGMARSPWDSIESEAFLNARAAGIHVAAAAGNSGPFEKTVSTPGNTPWLTSVAAATHDRGYGHAQIVDFAGGQAELVPDPLEGMTATGGVQGPIRLAADFDDPLCLEETEDDVFDGLIIVCERGLIARVDKSRNVAARGAVGMVLVNVSTDDNTLVADSHIIPSIHIDDKGGEQLVAWLESGDSHEVRLTGTSFENDDRSGDVVAIFSSRGPHVPVPTLLVPHVAAPGVNIYAADVGPSVFYPDLPETLFGFKSGTSMATPHVTGIYALINARHPDWAPAEAQSALMLTAEPEMDAETWNHLTQSIEVVPATAFAKGSGSARADRAVAAGLVMPITRDEYLDADPANGGRPDTLNMPFLVNGGCIVDCPFERRFKGVRNATWTVTFETETANLDVVATPDAFTLNTGEEQTVGLDVVYTGQLENVDLFGTVILTPDDASIPVARLPVAVRYVAGRAPERVTVPVLRNADVLRINDVVTHGTTNLRWNFAGFASATAYTATTFGDPTPTDLSDDLHAPFHHVIVSVSPDTISLMAEIVDAESPDLDLYIVRDRDLDGLPELVDLFNPVCLSGGPDSNESCIASNLDPGQYLVSVHNFGSPAGEAAEHTLRIALIKESSNDLTLINPGALAPGETVDLAAYWDHEMLEGETAMGVLTLGTRAQRPDNVGKVLVVLDRGPDEVSITVEDPHLLAGETATFHIELAENITGHARTLELRALVPEGFAFVSASDNPTVTGNAVSWTVERPAGAPPKTMLLEFEPLAFDGYAEAVLVVAHDADTGVIHTPTEEATSTPVIFESLPVALIDGEAERNVSANAGGSVTLDASASSSAGAEDELVFNWRQTGGPDVDLDVDGSRVTVLLPTTTTTTELVIELVASNGRHESLPAIARITVTPSTPSPPPQGNNGGGGTSTFILLILIMAPFARSRRMRRV